MIKRAGDKIETAADRGTEPVSRADLAASASANHTPAQFCHNKVLQKVELSPSRDTVLANITECLAFCRAPPIG